MGWGAGLLGVACLLATGGPRGAAEPIEILNMDSHWRFHVSMDPAGVVYRSGDGGLVTDRGEPLGRGHRLDRGEDGTLLQDRGWRHIPPMDGPWIRPDFDAGDWMTHRGPFFPGQWHRVGHGQGESPRLLRLAVRGQFVVEDPSAAGELDLAIRYRGGVAVYLNGHEVARGHLPEGPADAWTVAEDYRIEAVRIDAGRSEEAAAEAAALRLRTLGPVALPREHLRPGVNVLAIRALAAPMPLAARQEGRHATGWATVGIQEVTLRASPGGAVLPQAGMPPGIQVWTPSPILDLNAIPYGDPADLHGGIPPIRMVAARNTVVSGQAVLSSARPVRGVRASLGPFAGEGGAPVLAGGSARIRYPARTIEGMPYAMDRPDVLVDQATGTEPVQPVWVTVQVPAEAQPGTYRATLRIEADGLTPAAEVPVELVVHDWICPDPQDWRSLTSLVQSPHSVAWHYGAAMWSDRHLELLAPSLVLSRDLGNNLVYVPVIHPNFFATEHGIIVFQDRHAGLEPDFTFFDRYMDAVARHMGEPRRMTLVAWEPDLRREGATPTVSVRGEDGRLGHRAVPGFGEPGSEAIWRPLFDGVRERVRRRGWDERAIQVGVAGDGIPDERTVAFFAEIAPFARWHRFTHTTGLPRPGDDGRVVLDGKSLGLVEAPYNAGWDRGNRAGRLHGGFQRGWVEDWYEPMILFAGRGILHDNSPPVSFRMMPNSQVFNRSRGLARLGVDNWPVANPHRPGQEPRRMVHGAGGWGRLYRNKVRAVAAPGPRGALPTVRYEMLRQGFQDTEARIYLERALVDAGKRARLGEEIEREVRALVETEVQVRDMASYPPFDWTPGTDWHRRTERLYELAAEARRRLADHGGEP